MNLYYTPRSHFSRKSRILLDALGISFDLIDVGNVAESSADIFGPNPLLKVPTLVDHDRTVFESDHIAQYLVRQYDPGDRYSVLTSNIEHLKARAVMNGVMAAEVELILADRTGIDTVAYSRFEKIRGSIIHGLAWLEKHSEIFPIQPSYLGFHLISMWDHLALYKLLSLDYYPRLNSRIEALSKISYIASSTPL